MALFKQLRGNRASLDAQPITDGYAYFCVDDGTFHIDFKDANGTLKRKQINAKDAETLGLHSADEFLLATDINPVTTAGTGAAYTATVPRITSLAVGARFVMIPHTNSTSTNATLNVNGLGAKYLRQKLTTNNSATAAGTANNWILANKPVEVVYNGTYWVTDIVRPDANTLYGTVPVSAGGVPSSTTDDNGKFLRVVDGDPAWVTVPNAEEASF